MARNDVYESEFLRLAETGAFFCDDWNFKYYEKEVIVLRQCGLAVIPHRKSRTPCPCLVDWTNAFDDPPPADIADAVNSYILSKCDNLPLGLNFAQRLCAIALKAQIKKVSNN